MSSMVQRQTLRAVLGRVLWKPQRGFLLGGVCLLQLTAPVSGYAEASSNSQEQPVQTADHTALLCGGGHQFRVPIIRQLDADQLEPALSHCLAGNECVLPDEPIRTRGATFFQYKNAYGTPLLDSILGRASAYQVGYLYLRTTPLNSRPFDKGNVPFYRVSVSKIIEFIPENLKFMGENVIFTCSRGLPVFSKDENRASCFGIGQAPPQLSVIFSFNVGADLEGQWAIEADAWDKRDWSAWKAPLAEVEAAVRSMIVDGEGQNACRLESDK